MFRDTLRPVLTKHPLRHPHLYAIYVSRKHLPLKIRTFVDHLIEYSHIPHPWEDAEIALDRSESQIALPAGGSRATKRSLTAF